MSEADDILDNILDHMDVAWEYEESCDGGDFYNYPRVIKCKYCGADGLHWKETKKGWRLFEDKKKQHVCKFPNQIDFKNPAIHRR